MTRSNIWSMARLGLPFALLAIVFAALWIAGGASRADALGQVVVRITAWGCVLVGLVSGLRPSLAGYRAILFFLVATIALVLLQLVPLPLGFWQTLPGREMLAGGEPAGQQAQPWRVLAIVPSGAVNALSSLVVPLVVLLLVATLSEQQRAWLPGALLVLVAASMVVGLLQFAGTRFNNPFINDGAGEVSGIFANRNHFALFLAIGILLAPIWAFRARRRLSWRAPAALGLLLLFMLTILASGSRAGLLVGGGALVVSLVLAKNGLRRELSLAPRWISVAVIGATVSTIAIFVLLSVAADRAVSINRALSLEADGDIRALGLPTVLAMVRAYFPAGSGFGSFDAAFRIFEPLGLLAPSYLNHAHNDFLEVVLEGGVGGAILLVIAMLWWLWSSARAWRSNLPTAKLGSAILLLVFLASTVDYPARTPIIMAMIVIAAMWLNEGVGRPARSALPAGE